MAVERLPAWMQDLADEDIVFIKNFLLCSGSLKDIAQQYGVTYPTVRLRLDRLIQKIMMSENREPEPYVELIKRLAVDEKIDFEAAKLLINEYRRQTGEGHHGC